MNDDSGRMPRRSPAQDAHLGGKICPVCGNLIEIFSIDTEVACEHCGFIAYNDALSCAQWCQYAEKCLGPDLYQKIQAQSNVRKKHGGEKT